MNLFGIFLPDNVTLNKNIFFKCLKTELRKSDETRDKTIINQETLFSRYLKKLFPCILWCTCSKVIFLFCTNFDQTVMRFLIVFVKLPVLLNLMNCFKTNIS